MENDNIFQKKITSGLFWKTFENIGDQLITFVISMVLARLLGPDKYGTMTVMLMFVTIGNVMIQTGFQTALIQRKNIGKEELSSVFWMGLIVSSIIYSILFVCSPDIAVFFKDEAIKDMLRVLSLILFFGSVISIEYAIISRNMDFKLQCIATMLADLISGIAGIVLAYKNAGTWALIFQQLIKHVMLMLILMVSLRWLPDFYFSFSRIKGLFSYGWKVMVSGLIDTIYSNLYTPVISKMYTPSAVGLYGKANQFPQIIANAMAQTMQSVMLPAFSRLQDERRESARLLRNAIKLGSFIMFPLMFGLIAVSDPLINILLGSEWAESAALLRLCAIGYLVWHVHVANLQAINAVGRSDIYLRLEIIKKLLGVTVLVVSIPYGIESMLIFKAVYDIICTFINAWPNRKLQGYGPLRQWMDMLPELIASLIMFAFVYYLVPFALNITGFSYITESCSVGLMLIQVISGVIIYILAALFMRLESAFAILKMLSQRKRQE
ncbi:MAG: lipopolysaccharide biosynthesis protein [Eubacteriales bacterium]|nr:lipopolysaccharide biosynthesis protein [Eubacteriales bacterium]